MLGAALEDLDDEVRELAEVELSLCVGSGDLGWVLTPESARDLTASNPHPVNPADNTPDKTPNKPRRKAQFPGPEGQERTRNSGE